VTSGSSSIWWTVSPVGHGLIRLHVVGAGRPDVHTDWFRV
jgi:hypothetical protein